VGERPPEAEEPERHDEEPAGLEGGPEPAGTARGAGRAIAATELPLERLRHDAEAHLVHRAVLREARDLVHELRPDGETPPRDDHARGDEDRRGERRRRDEAPHRRSDHARSQQLAQRVPGAADPEDSGEDAQERRRREEDRRARVAPALKASQPDEGTREPEMPEERVADPRVAPEEARPPNDRGEARRLPADAPPDEEERPEHENVIHAGEQAGADTLQGDRRGERASEERPDGRRVVAMILQHVRPDVGGRPALEPTHVGREPPPPLRREGLLAARPARERPARGLERHRAEVAHVRQRGEIHASCVVERLEGAVVEAVVAELGEVLRADVVVEGVRDVQAGEAPEVEVRAERRRGEDPEEREAQPALRGPLPGALRAPPPHEEREPPDEEPQAEDGELVVEVGPHQPSPPIRDPPGMGAGSKVDKLERSSNTLSESKNEAGPPRG
jgi:hypothetical protein